MPKESAKPTTDPHDHDQVMQLIEQAQKGSLEALAELRQVLDARPEIWQVAGDMARQAEHAILRLQGPPDAGFQEMITRKLQEMKDDLTEGGNSPLEELLIERITVCWLGVYVAEKMAATQPGCGFDAAISAENARKYLDGAHRRYLQAIKSLAVVRRLVQPTPTPLEIASVFRKGSAANQVRDSELTPSRFSQTENACQLLEREIPASRDEPKRLPLSQKRKSTCNVGSD